MKRGKGRGFAAKARNHVEMRDRRFESGTGRCVCGKVRYATRKIAIRRARDLAADLIGTGWPPGKRYINIYLCEHDRCWHIGKSREPSGRASVRIA